MKQQFLVTHRHTILHATEKKKNLTRPQQPDIQACYVFMEILGNAYFMGTTV